MDDDQYQPNINYMLQGGGNGGAGGSGGNTFLYEGGQAPQGMAPNRGQFGPGGMLPQQQQYAGAPAGDFAGMSSQQVGMPRFGCGPTGMMPAHMQMQRQMGQFPPAAAAYGMPQTAAGKAPTQIQQPAKTKGKRSKKAAAGAEMANTAEIGMASMASSGSGQPMINPYQQQQMSQQQMAYYYKGQVPPGMMPPAAATSQEMQKVAQQQKWMASNMAEEQQKQQFHQQQMGQQQPQQYGPQQMQAAMYGTAAVAGQMQQPQQQQYPGYPTSSSAMLQQPQQSKPQSSQQQQAAAQHKSSAITPSQQQQQMPYGMAQQPQFYAGQQQQPYPPTSQQQMQQPQSAAGYQGMGLPTQGTTYPPVQYPTPDYPQQHQAAALQRQAYYAHQQMLATGGPMPSAGSSYYQPYMNQYMAQQQQLYREMFECDQQLSALMAQPQQQNAEFAMRVEKLQMHRGYLQGQLVQLQQHAAAAAAASGGMTPSGMGMAVNVSREAQQPQQYMATPAQQAQPQQYPPYSGPQSTALASQSQLPEQQAQQHPIPVQQKLPPSSQPPPYGAANAPPPAYQHPPAPQPQSVAGFHSPTGVVAQPATPTIGPPQQHQMSGAPPDQLPQQQQPMSQHYPQHMTSCAVMSASNQVQVNIRPAEVPGRTLISVYHSQDIPPTAVVSSAGMHPYPVASDSASSAAKDSIIPPEPVPSNIRQRQRERELQLQRQQQQQLQQEQLEQQTIGVQQPPPPMQTAAQQQKQPAKPYSPPLPYVLKEGHEMQAKSSAADIGITASSTFRPRVSSSINQPATVVEKPSKSPPQQHVAETEKRTIVEEKSPTPPARTSPKPVLEQNIAVSCQFTANRTHNQCCSTICPIPVQESLEISLMSVEKKKEEPMVEVENADQFSAPIPAQEDLHDKEPAIPPFQLGTIYHEEAMPIVDEVRNAEVVPIAIPARIEEPLSEMDIAQVEEEIAPKVEQNEKVMEENTEMEAVNKPLIAIESETLTPSTSDAFLSRADDKESTADDSLWGADVSTKETTPMDADELMGKQPTEAPSYSLAAGSSKKSRGKKRKPVGALDWNRDEDDEYVGSSKKKKGKKSVTRKEQLMMDELAAEMPPDVDEELLLMEKRRSARQVTSGKKAKYGVDSEEDEGEEEPQQVAKPKEKEGHEQLQLIELDERTVEKIMGARWGKRKVKKSMAETAEEKGKDEETGKKEEEKGEKEEEKGEIKMETDEEKKADDLEEEIAEKPEEEEKPKKDETDEGKKDEEEGKDSDEQKNEEKPDEEKEPKNGEKNEPEGEEEEIEVEEFYVKFKNYSYLHCEWKTIEELEDMGDKRMLAKVNRYKQKFGETTTIAGEDDEQEYFNDDNTVVARILDETYDEQEQQHYVFVKWKSLAYDECTWELLQNVPEQKVDEFRHRIKFDPCKAKETPRLSPAEWKTKLTIPRDKVYKNENMLREYQHEGVNWLLWTWTNGRNCILADEMGLGKTVQTIAFFQSLYDIGIHGPFLVVVPLSTLSNWEREFENWTDINAIVYHGGANSRQIIQNYEFFYKKSDRRRVTKFDALITTYEVVVQDVEVLRKINFRVCVIDEAHRIKNRNCKLLQSGLLSLKMEYRVLLTGTPLQNNIQELFSLLNFLEPEQFANSEAFLHQFGQCQTEDQVQKLQEILKPMMLRRLKEDVEKELQPKEETIIEVQLSNIQKKYYRAVLERNFTHLMKGTTPSLINTMMQLRKCCNHPYLINGAEEQILAEVKHSHPEKTEEEIQTMSLISSSGKLVLIDKLLPKLHADGHKVLIFSQMVRVLDLLEEYLTIKGYPFERIDGNIRGNERQAAIDRFSRPENYDRFVFLLCTRAGGLGINLTAADTVIIFDSDWNPQNDLQAQARCHRIGQTKPVKIYRLITANSYEREMFDKASLKLGLDKAVLQSMLHKSDNTQQMTRQEVEDLLRKGAYGAIMDEDNEGTKFSEEDIDTILLRRTQTIRLEPGVKGSTFAKASFTSSHNREDIDIQDPDFWSKWAKKANIDVNALSDELSSKHLIVHEPRARKKRFEAENPESGDDGLSDDDDGQSTPGTSKIAEGVKSRSSKRRRRGAVAGDEDDDYPYKPDELAFNKSSYFKVEKLLAQYGWGRWAVLKAFSELTEHEIEHISRTLLLHCIREFRGDDKVRDYVWKLVTPPKEAAKLKEDAEKAVDTAKYHQGWAALPEFNPPFICVDASFQRHLHRHSNKLLNRIQQLHFLKSKMVDLKSGPVTYKEKVEESYENELKLELPSNLESWLIMPNWDRQCDRDLLFGVYKHGMDNWDQLRADPKLCYTRKNIQFPNTIDLNNRFKYLISTLQRGSEPPPSNGPGETGGNSAETKPQVEWSKVEESDFMRILRNYGVKDDTNSENVISWGRFRELSICLHKKTDADLLEMLYCVLAMCTKQQGGGLSAIDERRAERVDAITAKTAEKLMNRLHLMRKVHAIITMGIQNIRGMLKMVSLDVMPKGWTEAHDEHLLIVVDKFGLEDIHGKVKLLPKLFESVASIDENMLLRRVVEICLTLETGKWSGTASIEMVQEENSQNLPSTSGTKNVTRSGGGAGNGRKKADQSVVRKSSNPQNQGAIVDKSNVASTSSGKPTTASTGSKSSASMSYGEQQALLKMMEQMTNPNYLMSLMSLMNPSTSSSVSTSGAAAFQQQFQQLQTLMALSALGTNDPTLASLGASLASLGAATPSLSTASMTPTKSTTSLVPAESAKTDALNLSKRSGQEASKTSISTKSAKMASASLASTAKPQNMPSSSGDATGSLSTGLSTSAINKLSQMSVPELLAYSNLSQDIRIPVVHIETGQRIESEKAPMLKSLDQWLKTNPKYNVDLLSLATSHPSLFSSTNVATSGSKTPVSTPKSMVPATVDSQKLMKSSTPVSDKNVSVSSVTQQLIEQAKKSSAGGVKDLGQSPSTIPTSVASLFGMSDLLQGTSSSSSSSSTAQQMAALNQFLAGLSPGQSTASQQLQAANLAALAASGTGSSQSLKGIEQQILLLQQAMSLGGGATTGSAGGSLLANPYTSLYMNPADIFGTKTSHQSSSSFSGIPSSAFQQSSSSSSSADAAMAALLAASGFPVPTTTAATVAGASSKDLNASLSAAALTSDLYLAAMASSLQPFLGQQTNMPTTPGTATNPLQQPQPKQHSSSSAAKGPSSSASMAGMNAALEQLLQAAGMDPSALIGLGLGATSTGTSSNASTTSVSGVLTKGTSKMETAKTVSLPKSTAAQQQQQRESPVRKTGLSGVKGLKLNAVLEKLNASSSTGGNSAATPPAAQTENKREEEAQQAAPEEEQPPAEETPEGGKCEKEAGERQEAGEEKEEKKTTADD